MAGNVASQLSASVDESLLSCIKCREVAEQPLLLRCLHNCCSVCADRAATAQQDPKTLLCSVCDVITDFGIMKQRNSFIAEQVRRLKALRDAGKCAVCSEDGKPDELADVWCIQCQRSLCSACMPGHSRYNRSHATISIQEIGSWTELLHAEGPQCSLHGKQLELLCFDCKLAKCTDCVRQCESLGHSAPQLLKGPKGKSLLANTRESITHCQMLLLGKSQELLRPKNLVRDVQSARAIHLDELKTKKKYAMDALSKSYEEAEGMVKEIYDQLEESAAALQCLAEQLEQSLQHALKYVSSLTNMADVALLLEQQVILRSRLKALSKQLDGFKVTPDVGQLVTLNFSLPDDLNKIVASWMRAPERNKDLGRALAEVLALKDDAGRNISTGATTHRITARQSQAPVPFYARRQQLHRSSASGSFRLPFHCNDLSVTSENHVLLAALEQGMREYDVSGHELSSWRPPTQSNGQSDCVSTVAALDDGRAVVGMLWSQLVVLLRRSSADRAWLVDGRIAVLQSPPWQLSVRGDIVAVALYQDDGQKWVPGPQLQLLRLSSGQLLYKDTRDYDVQSVALTAAAVVTTSWDRVKFSDCREAYVVDCRCHRGRWLWRHVLSSEVWVAGVCAAPAGQLYVAVLGRGGMRRKDCVRVIDREAGKKVEDFLLSGRHGVKVPVRLSLSRGQQQQKVLAVLSKEDASKPCNEVTVHAATGC